MGRRLPDPSTEDPAMRAGQGLFSRPRPDPTPTGASRSTPGGSIHASGPLVGRPSPGQSAPTRSPASRTGTGCQAQLAELSEAALLVIDLDGFRTVNEVLGYDIGDEVLRECARRLMRTLPEGSTLSRIGDDEFAAVLTVNVDPGHLGRRCQCGTAGADDDPGSTPHDHGQHRRRHVGRRRPRTVGPAPGCRRGAGPGQGARRRPSRGLRSPCSSNRPDAGPGSNRSCVRASRPGSSRSTTNHKCP